MRLFFHLVSELSEIPDEDGFEVEDVEDLRPQILNALEEISKEKPQLFQEGSGWRLNVADASGQILFSLALDETGDRFA